MRHLAKGAIEDIAFVLDIEDGIGTEWPESGVLYFAGIHGGKSQPCEYILDPREMAELLKTGKLNIPEYGVNPCDFDRDRDEALASFHQGESDSEDASAAIAKFDSIEEFLDQSPLYGHMSRIVMKRDFVGNLGNGALIRTHDLGWTDDGQDQRLARIGLIEEFTRFQSNVSIIEYRLDSDVAGLTRKNAANYLVEVVTPIPVAYDDLADSGLVVRY